MPNLFNSFRDKFNNFYRSGINNFSNVKDTFQRGINSFSNSRLVRFIGSDEFGNIVKEGSQFLESKHIISRKTEDKARNLVDLLSELKKGNYGSALNYAGSMLSNDFASLPSGHFREAARRRFLDRITI